MTEDYSDWTDNTESIENTMTGHQNVLKLSDDSVHWKLSWKTRLRNWWYKLLGKKKYHVKIEWDMGSQTTMITTYPKWWQFWKRPQVETYNTTTEITIQDAESDTTFYIDVVGHSWPSYSEKEEEQND